MMTLDCLAYARHFRPTFPQSLAGFLFSNQCSESQHLPYILEIAGKSQADPHDAQLSPHKLLKVLEGYAWIELAHIVLNTENSRGGARVAHTTCAERDELF